MLKIRYGIRPKVYLSKAAATVLETGNGIPALDIKKIKKAKPFGLPCDPSDPEYVARLRENWGLNDKHLLKNMSSKVRNALLRRFLLVARPQVLISSI